MRLLTTPSFTPIGCLFLILALAGWAPEAAAQATFNVTVATKTSSHPNFGSGHPMAYVIDGVEANELTLNRGETYTFQMNNVNAVHPFYISTSATGAGSGVFTSGVTGNFATGNAALTFTVPQDAPGLLYYQCQSHLLMGWQMSIVDAEPTLFVADLSGSQSVPGNASRGSGTVTGSLVGSTLTVTGAFEGLESDFNADIAGGAHLHLGYAGQAGPVSVSLNATVTADGRSGAFDAANNTFELDQDQIDALQSRQIYVNIHSVDLPAGEIRGQMLPSGAAYFRANLSGRAEIPANASQGYGAVILELDGQTITASGSFSDLESAYNADVGSHIHVGPIHENGPVEFAFTAEVSNDGFSGTFAPGENQFELTEAQLTALISGEYYVNVHSVDLPAGELRGQIFPLAVRPFEAWLVAQNEVADVDSPASGGAVAFLDGSTLRIGGSFGDLASDFNQDIGAHIHIAAVGENGPVEFPLEVALEGDLRGGTFPAGEANTFTLSAAQRDAMLEGRYYFNVHTVDNPGGEIRGQILPATNLAPEAPEITSPPDGGSVVLEGAPATPFVAEWDASDANGNPLAFVWQLSTDADFDDIVFEAATGLEALFSTDFGTVDGLLADLGVGEGQTVTVYHRAVASDGGFRTAGVGASADLTRGMLTSTDPGAPTIAFHVAGAAPNPFTTSTTLRLDLPARAAVTVVVFDVLGRRVLDHDGGILEAGADQEIQLNGSRLAAGQYLYRVTADTGSDTLMGSGRMVRIR